MELLFEMLRYKRRYQTKTEKKFIHKFIDSVEGMKNDGAGNRYIQVGKPNGVMFSCHTDTVHGRSGMQKICVDEHKKQIFKDDNNPLGADDAAGMWLMLNMIDAGVNGLYIFHRGEERGGIGSSWLLKHTPSRLKGITKAIAFDRKGTNEIITHQASQRCCSDKFAEALAKQFYDHGLLYDKSYEGTFTDTATYMDDIPECTNVSCGYDKEHTAWETLDYRHLNHLLDACLNINWEELPSVRDHTIPEYQSWGSRYGGWDYDEDKYSSRPSAKTTGEYAEWHDLYNLVLTAPEDAADLLYELGATYDYIADSTIDVDKYMDDVGYKQ